MIRQEYYTQLADTFECSIGVATVIGPASEKRGNRYRSDDVVVNRIIAERIIDGEYKEFRRKVLVGERGKDRRTKESTFYKSLIDGIESKR